MFASYAHRGDAFAAAVRALAAGLTGSSRPPTAPGRGPPADGAAGAVAHRRAGRRAAGAAARAAGPAAGLVLPAAGQRRPAAGDRPDHGLLGDQRRAVRRPAATRSPSIAQQAIVGRASAWSRSGSASGCRAHLPGAGPVRRSIVAFVLLVVLDVLALLAAVEGAARTRSSGRSRADDALALPRPGAGAAVRARQVRAGAVGRGRAGPQGRARSARWRELVTAAVPGGRPAVRAGRLQRPRHDALPADPVRRAALGGRRAAAGLRRACSASAWPASSR